MRGTRLGVAAAIVASALVAPGRARAESGATLVAIVTAEPNSSLTRRVRAELEGLGVDVIVLKPPDEGSPSRAPLEQAARSVGAVAAVRLVASSEGKVEVWVADRVTGKAVVRELDAPESGASDAAVAIGSVELLRASLMELHSGEPPHGDAPANEKIQALALALQPPEDRRAWDSARAPEPSSASAGSVPSADADIGVWVRVASHLGARLVGAYLAVAGARGDPVGRRRRALAALRRDGHLGLRRRVQPRGCRAHRSGSPRRTCRRQARRVPPFVSASEARWSPRPDGGSRPRVVVRARLAPARRRARRPDLAPRARDDADERRRLVGRSGAPRARSASRCSGGPDASRWLRRAGASHRPSASAIRIAASRAIPRPTTSPTLIQSYGCAAKC